MSELLIPIEPITAFGMNDRALRVASVHSDRRVRQLLRFLLENDERFTVTADVATAAEAPQAAADADVVVLDIQFVDGDGFDTASDLKRSQPALAIVMYSSFDPPYLRAQAAAHGVEAYIGQSAGADELLDVLAHVRPC